MINLRLIPLITALPFSLTTQAATIAPDFQRAEQHTRYIIQFEENTLSTQRQQTLAKLNITPLKRLNSINALVASLSPAQMKQLSQQSHIALIEPDPVRYLQDDQTTWGISRVQAPQVSDAAAGNQTVCIIDTGYDLGHEDLMAGAHVTGEVVDAINGEEPLGVWSQDDWGHGTHIAGIISSVDNNFGLVGINPGNHLNLHNVKIINNPHAWKIWGSDMIAAVEACTNAGATVINMSIGGVGSSEAERLAMQTAYDNGTLLFAAAGNRGSEDYFYPASYDAVVSVGAIDEDGQAWMYSQHNDQTELVAPGVNIKSTIPGNQYGKKDGTSIATAFASGTAALVWSHYPDCTAPQIRDVLTQSARDAGAPGLDTLYGYGEIQAKAALDLLDSNGCNAGSSLKFYYNEAEFDSELPGNTLIEDFEGWRKNSGLSRHTVNGISWVAGTNLYVASAGYTNFGVPITESAVLTSNGHESWTMSFQQTVYAAGMDTYDNVYGPMTFTITLQDGTTVSDVVDHDPTIVGFWGVSSPQPIKSIHFTSVSGGSINTGVDNIKTR